MHDNNESLEVELRLPKMTLDEARLLGEVLELIAAAITDARSAALTSGLLAARSSPREQLMLLLRQRETDDAD